MGQNGLNNYDSWEWDKFIRLQWTLHVQSAMTTVKKKDLMYLRQLLRGFVVHGRDHAINEIFIFCRFYVLESCSSHLWRSTGIQSNYYVSYAVSTVLITTVNTRLVEALFVGLLFIEVLSSSCLHFTQTEEKTSKLHVQLSAINSSSSPSSFAQQPSYWM